MIRFVTAACFIGACCASASAVAQTGGAATYPSKPVRIVVGFAPGGGADIVGRIIAQRLTEAFGHSFVVENRPGASATIATDYVMRSAPDGYTLLVGVPTAHSVMPVLSRRLNYDVLRDFAPIGMIGTTPLLLAVHPSLPIRSVADLVRVAKARPGQLTFGAGGIGTPPHMAAELFKQRAGVDMLLVPYQGEAPAIVDLVGGQISLIFANISAVLQQVRAGKLRGIAVTALQRVPTAMDFPTVAEAGMPGFAVESWYGLLTPTGTPAEIIAKLNHAVVRAFEPQDVRDRLVTQGIFVQTSTPEQLAAYMKAEIAKWAQVVKEAGLKMD
ncbi:MAG TPA: tripartite tricarboxylate transporter substrate binding protein [Burkholderiales bacterium]|nr:tripartite tricarboxylate transporter substrate binding protein [Burkholderiales bacterium]